MFPSTSSIAHLSSPSHPNPSPYITDLVPGDIFPYQNPSAIPSLPTNPAISETLIDLVASSNIAAMNSKQVMCASNAYPCNPFDPIPCKRPAKKDRHSKICTAQGLRDRRVRLSIAIARRFFDLQDMLGFDKASKTLEWLLSKSRKSIKELSENGAAKTGSSNSTCEVVSENGYREGMPSKTESLAAVSNGKKMRRLQKAAVKVVLAKESRAKARARARERTRVKICTRGAHESTKCPDPGPHIWNHLAREASDSYSSHNMTSSSSLKVVSHEVKHPITHSVLANQVPQGGVVEESIVIKRKLKPSTVMSCQQNLVISKEVNCNPASSSKYYLPNLPPSRDINSSTIAHSGLFNVNLSAGLQIYGKIWETDYNQCYE